MKFGSISYSLLHYHKHSHLSTYRNFFKTNCQERLNHLITNTENIDAFWGCKNFQKTRERARERQRKPEKIRRIQGTNDVGGAKQEEKSVTGKGLHNSDKRAEMNVMNYNPSHATSLTLWKKRNSSHYKDKKECNFLWRQRAKIRTFSRSIELTTEKTQCHIPMLCL